ncbi:MAG: hypothetical protein ACREBQ_10910, partial [Nitrososphaerales archaeon]
LLQCGILLSLASIVVAPHPVAAQTITKATAAPGVTPANFTTDVKFSAKVTGHPALVELIYQNGPAGHPVVVGQLRKKECRDHDDGRDGEDRDQDRGCKNRDRYTLSQRFNFPVGQAQFQISATGSQGQVLSPVIPVLSLNTPSGFTINSDLLAVGGPLNLNTFNSNYIQGGIIPHGGADIHVSTVPLHSPPFNNYIDIQLNGTTITSRGPINVSGVSCTQVFYTDSYEGTPLSFNNEVIYCPSGKSLYKFNLSYNAGDSHANQYLSSFQQVISNAQFAP